MSAASSSLAKLMNEHQIDVYQLFEYFDEAIYREVEFLTLTAGFSTRESHGQTQDILITLRKFKESLRVFSENTNLDSLNHGLQPQTDFMRLTNALKFLLLLRKFPDVLEEFTTP